MMDCEDVQKYLPDLLDGSLGVERTQVEAHVATCLQCSEETASLAEYRRLVSSLPAIEVPGGFATRVMAKVREAESPPRLWERLFSHFQIKIPLQAAAVVLIAVLAIYLYQKQPLQDESGVTFQAESSFRKQKETDTLEPSATRAPDTAPKTREFADETQQRVQEFKDAAPETKPQPLAKTGEQDNGISGSLQENASEAGSGRLEQSSPSAETETKRDAASALQPKKAGKPLSPPGAPLRRVAPSLDSLRSDTGAGGAFFAERELAIRLKEPAHDNKNTGDRLASDRIQVERQRSLAQEEAKTLEQARQQVLQTGESQTVWTTIERNQYELFKQELADLGTLEMESSTSKLNNDTTSKSSDRVRIKVTLLPPIASENPAPPQP